MDITHKELSNSNNSDLYLSILLKNTPEEKTAVLREYRKRMDKEKGLEHSLLQQNNDVMTAVQNLVDSSNEKQILISLEIENILLSELESCQQVIDKHKVLIKSLEKQLIQKRENEKSVIQSIRKFKEDNQREMARLVTSHQEELSRLTASHQEELRKITDNEKSPSFDINSLPFESEAPIENIVFDKALATETTTQPETEKLFYKLTTWPDFNDLTKGDRIIPLATRLMAQQMSLKQMENFLGGPTEKQRLLRFIDELTSIGLLTSTNTKEEPQTINDKPEKNNRLQLFKRIRSSLGI
ncbi:hypothetical protein [Psychromonas sp. 14N.309.X.WAT.B.A12]|jgi:DNA polymerase III gamma/tau subunit|uniref:hypothetical protein n=1 Tax=unclassified Psychromonas TaxID=2614957 RepID=UPI0025B0C0EC|nr:hypothetical protein [Psychromonas sp. 14N.309.X.WAT.B.A12]MDN2663752.1 hypothetical protein [Psychromonas sp. 14N.309.X.WAT.B.A12]